MGQLTLNERVPGSSPGASTNKIKDLHPKFEFGENYGTTYGTTIVSVPAVPAGARKTERRSCATADGPNHRDYDRDSSARFSRSARGMVMTDDDIEFDETDRAALRRLEAMMQDRGYRPDQRGFWVLPGAELVLPRDSVEDDDD
jgi:hypothetical protein